MFGDVAPASGELQPSGCALPVVQVFGLVIAKYPALVAAVFPMAAVAVRSLQFGAGRLSRREVPKGWFWGPLTAVVLGLVLSTPHWLKNWLWYGDPFYPLLRRYFQVRPWTPDSEYFYQVFSSQNWVPTGTPREKLEGLVRALFDYSIRIYNWPDFHKDFPTFGSLFTFCLVGLVILGWKRRLWALVLGIHLGIAVWFMLFQHERYLQPLVPLMAGVCSSVAVLAWKQGWAARVGVLALGGVQLVWGLDIVFWPLHKMTGKSGIELASEFFARGYDKNYGARLRPFEDLASIGRTLPKSANVLLHRDHLRTGLGTRTVWDALRVQLGISYGALGSARALHRKLKEFEVTHVVWEYARASEEDSLAGELVFHTYASRSLLNRKTFGRKSVAEVPLDEPPPERAAVFYFGCRGQPASGLYRIEDLNVQVYWRLPGTPPPTYPAPRVPLENDLDVLVAAADRAIIERSCPQAPQELDGFEEVARSDARIYFARRLEK
nr:MAG: hypothetical protein DIU78_09135 [Pseudomonadota bacterium]